MIPTSDVDRSSSHVKEDSSELSSAEIFFPPEDTSSLEEDDESSHLAEDAVPPVSSFEELPLSDEVLASIKAMGWSEPTEVQALCLPHTLKGEDVAGFAQTGTGKTGVFLITLAVKILSLEGPEAKKNRPPDAVILAPTRELALQIYEDSTKLFQSLKIRSTLIFGGMEFEKQILELKKSPQVLVATPGRLKDFVQRKVVNLKAVSLFVCDEVDRMFDIGFIEDVEYFLSKVPDQAQKLMFSATSNDSLEELCFEYLNRPKFLAVSHDEITPERITQKAILCSVAHKLRVFMGLLRSHEASRAIIFTNTKITAAWLHYKLSHNGFETDLITGDLPQKKRISLIRKIKAGKIRYLIATDVASRGLHISGITHVYNFDLPTEPANYIHRIGRTARAGATGASYSLVCDEYGSHLVGINNLMKTPVACEWFPEEYLSIKDQAPDPFLNNFGKPKPHSSPMKKNQSSSGRKKSTHQKRSQGSSARKSKNGSYQKSHTKTKHHSKAIPRGSSVNQDQKSKKKKPSLAAKSQKLPTKKATEKKSSWLGSLKKKIKKLVS